MGLEINEIILDPLTSDPSPLPDGCLWHRSDLNELRHRDNGVTKVLLVIGNESAIDHDLLTNYLITQHRIINDAGSTTIELLSASKIIALVNAVSSGIDNKDPIDTSTEGLGNITLSGEQTLNGLLTSASDVLVLEQTVGSENGIYTTAAGAWVRRSDCDEDAEVTNGMRTFIDNSGSTVYRHQYILTTADPITVGTTSLSFAILPALDFGTTAGTATEGDDSRVPAQDENNALVGTNGTPSSTNKYVTDSDPRNSDSRAPTSHTHSASDVTDFDTEVGNHSDVSANTTHSGQTDNPHDVTKSQIGLGDVEDLKVNLVATANPTTTDDTGSGYSVGSRWVNVTTDEEFVCLDNTASAAVWKRTTAVGGGSTVKEVFYRVDNSNDSSGDYITKEILSNGTGFFTFKVPFDFVSLVDLKLVSIPQSTVPTADIDLFSDYASVGELKNIHSESDTTATYALTIDEITELDISGLFSSILAGDYCGLKVDHNSAGNHDYLGIRIKYNI